MSSHPSGDLLRALLHQSLFVDSVAASAGLRRVDLDALIWLQLAGESTAGEVGSALGLSSGGTSGVLDRLERETLVERLGDSEDRRRVLIRLTPEGARLLATFLHPLQSALETRHSTAETEALAALAATLESAASAARAKAPNRVPSEPSGEVDGDYSVALGQYSLCTAEFVGRFGHVRVRALERGSDRLFQARLASGAKVRLAEDAVTFLGRRSPIGAAPDGEISLSPAIPWSLRIPGGAMTLDADLARVTIETIEITGGSNELLLRLGNMPGSLRIGGGANRMELRLPASLPVSIGSRGGTTRIDADGESRRIMGRGNWELPAPGGQEPMEIVIRGGASTLTVIRD